MVNCSVLRSKLVRFVGKLVRFAGKLVRFAGKLVRFAEAKVTRLCSKMHSLSYQSAGNLHSLSYRKVAKTTAPVQQNAQFELSKCW